MNELTSLPGIRAVVLLLLARRGIRGHLTRSAVTVVVIALATVAVIGTAGRTEAARRSLLARLEVPDARLVRVVDRDGQAALTQEAVVRLAQATGVKLTWSQAREVWKDMTAAVAPWKDQPWGREVRPSQLRFAGSRG